MPGDRPLLRWGNLEDHLVFRAACQWLWGDEWLEGARRYLRVDKFKLEQWNWSGEVVPSAIFMDLMTLIKHRESISYALKRQLEDALARSVETEDKYLPVPVAMQDIAQKLEQDAADAVRKSADPLEDPEAPPQSLRLVKNKEDLEPF